MINSNQAPLVSVIVLCYRNFRYVYDAIESVLDQDYPNLEIVVSDDGSKNFPQSEIEEFIDKHKRKNITSVTVKHHEQNSGTVKHLNKAISLTTGEYVMSLSADDMIANVDVVTKYVDGLQNAPNCDILMAQTAMYDEDMETLQYYFVQPHIRDILLYDQKSDALLEQLVQHAYLPSVSTFFKKTFFEKYGKFDETYDLVEDWSLHLRIAREHIPVAYLDFPSIKHRSGGVSHGNTEGTNTTFYRYLQDLTRTYKNDVQPYLNRVAPEVRKTVKHRHRKDKAWIDFNFHAKHNGLLGMIGYAFSHPLSVFEGLAPMIYHQCYGRAWHPLLLSLLFLFVAPWIKDVVSLCCMQTGISYTVSQVSALVVDVAAMGMSIFSLVFLLAYAVSAFYCLVDEHMNLYF